jgi:predicted membrane-bound spermidine synthase
MRPKTLPLAGLIFFSGLCALIYQVAWLREFRLVFGASTAASAAVLAIFMGGMGLGNAWLGRRADRHPRPLRFYARLELGVALGAAVSPLLIDLIGRVYIALGGQLALGSAGATLVRLALSVLVMGLPTVWMGGTLPAAARAITSAEDPARRAVALLYGANTLGAVLGAALSTFFAIEAFGTRTTLWLACAINLLVSLAAFRLARESAAANTAVGSTPQKIPRQKAVSTASLPPPVPAGLIYAAAAAVGFVFFLMELVWYRLLGPLLGGTTYTFGLILCVALAGIGLGSAAYARFFQERRVTLRGLAGVCGLEAVLLAFPLALGDRLALWTAELHAANTGGFSDEVWNWAAIAALVILPAALVSGWQFPLLIALLGRGNTDLGKQVGLAAAWNTVGAICGSLAGGFGLLPLLSAPGAWRAAVGLLVLLSLVLLLFSLGRDPDRRKALLPLAVAAAAVVFACAPGPTAVWRHSGIGAGRARLPTKVNDLHQWQNAQRHMIVWQAEGIESSVAIAAQHGLAFIVNGKSDGNALADAGTQIMLGLLGGCLHPRPRTAFVVGLGTGETAGWLADVPSLEHVDVVELEPALDEMARRCAAVNHDVLHHAKVRRIYNDAREVLLTSTASYDLIVSEPSNPYRSGVASLFTREFYLAGRKRLNEGGLFVQWLQAYEVDERTVRTILTTLRSVFPAVELWQTSENDLLLIGTQRPIEYPAGELRQRIAHEPFQSGLLRAWRIQDLEGVLAHYVGGPALVAEYLRGQNITSNTDDRNQIEYACARTLGSPGGFKIAILDELAATAGGRRPPLDATAIDWDRVARRRRSMQATYAHAPPAEEKPLTLPAADPAELASLAYVAALAGDRRAWPLLEQLRTVEPAEAEAIGGILLWKQRQYPQATESLAAAFGRLREDPWPMREIVDGALAAAAQLAQADPRLAEKLYAALAVPFAVGCDEDRRSAVACIVASLYKTAAAVDCIAAYEPNVPWTGSFLRLRQRVYAAAGHPLAAQARADLDEFQRQAQEQAAMREADAD